MVMGVGDDLPDASEVSASVLFQTSGSTGDAKWVVLSKRALLVSATAVNEHLGVGEDSCWGLALPLRHVGGFGVVARAYQAGCQLACFGKRWDAGAFTEWLADEQVTHTSLVPTQVHDLVAAQVAAPASLKAVVVGGGRLDRQLGRDARRLGWPVLASYGMTEAGSQIATQGLDALEQDYEPSPIPVLPHWQLQVGDDQLLKISGEALFSGCLVQKNREWSYCERSEAVHTTSDRVELDATATGVSPLGRADLQVKVLGELVDLEALERELVGLSDGTISAGSLAIIAVPDPRAGCQLVPVFDAVLEKSVVEQVLLKRAASAPGYCQLQSPVFLDDFPRSELGKPMRAVLKSRVSSADR